MPFIFFMNSLALSRLEIKQSVIYISGSVSTRSSVPAQNHFPHTEYLYTIQDGNHYRLFWEDKRIVRCHQ